MAKDGKKERPGGAAPPRTEEDLPRLPKEKVTKKKLLGKGAPAAGAAKPAKKLKKLPKPREDEIETNIETGDEDGGAADGDDDPVVGPSENLFDELPEGDLNVRRVRPGCARFLLPAAWETVDSLQLRSASSRSPSILQPKPCIRDNLPLQQPPLISPCVLRTGGPLPAAG